MNYKCTISYRGTNYYGWAKQQNLPTIEKILNDTIYELFNVKAEINGSGRTDRYVHAIAQVFNLKSEKINLEPKQLMHALNSRLPSDIKIISCEAVKESFHARFNAKSKTYIYKLSSNPEENIFTNELVYQYNKPINLEKFTDFQKLIIGKHNFLSFSTSELADTVREIYDFRVWKNGDVYNFEITGNGFLRNMVRMIIGTFLNYLENKITLEDVKHYLDEPKKGQAIRKVNGCGLYLLKVVY